MNSPVYFNNLPDLLNANWLTNRDLMASRTLHLLSEIINGIEEQNLTFCCSIYLNLAEIQIPDQMYYVVVAF